MIGFLIALAVIVGIGMVRIGADITYRQNVLTIRARIAGIPFTILPRDKKTKKPKKKKEKNKEKSAEKKTTDDSKKKKLTFDDLKLYLKLAADILRLLKRRIPPLWHAFVVEKLYVNYVVASSDAAQTAETYGKLCAAVSAAYPVYREVLDIRRHDVTIDVDFCADRPAVDADIRVRLTIGAIVIFVVTFAWGALKAYLQMKKEQSRPDETGHRNGKKEQNKRRRCGQ